MAREGDKENRAKVKCWTGLDLFRRSLRLNESRRGHRDKDVERSPCVCVAQSLSLLCCR